VVNYICTNTGDVAAAIVNKETPIRADNDWCHYYYHYFYHRKTNSFSYNHHHHDFAKDWVRWFTFDGRRLS
jgi:hypothetical protein